MSFIFTNVCKLKRDERKKEKNTKENMKQNESFFFE
jgi:hypothetical protein